MKIVQINTVFATGSTGRIVLGLHNTILGSGNESAVAYGRVTGKRYSEDNLYLVGNKPDFIGHVLVNFFAGKSGFVSTGNTRKLLSWLDKIKPDIIHLHNLHGFYVNVEMLFEYIKSHEIPVIWTFHDCWPFTGQCAHFDYAGCDKWKTGCHDCPIYRSNYPYSLFKDNSKDNYEHKKAVFTGVKDLTIVTPSSWLAVLVKQSFLNDYPVKVIPNGIDTEIFAPVPNPSGLSDNNLDSSVDPKILLGVANIWSKPKGLEYLLRLSDDLKDDPQYQIVIIGLNKYQCSSIKKKHPANVLPIMRTSSQKELAAWYQKAYAFINPTLEDTFPTTNLEALACGTPVIAFNTGGSPEALDEGCGIVVEKGNYEALKAAVTSDRSFDSDVCRKKALEYTKDTANRRYLELYNAICKTNQ